MASRSKALKLLPAAVALLLVGSGTVVAADDAWRTKPPDQWTVDDALEVLRNSAWAHQEDVLIHRGSNPFTSSGRLRTRGDAAQFGGWASFLVRWESAQPVMQAFNRLDELGEGTSAHYQGRPPQLPEEYYVVTVKTESLPRSGFDFLERMMDENLLQFAELRTSRTTVKPVRLERSGLGASAAVHFYFPVAAEGRALIADSRQEIEFRLRHRRFNLNSKFKLEPEWIPQVRKGT